MSAKTKHKIAVVAKALDGSGLSANVYVERISQDFKSCELVDTGKTDGNCEGMFRSKELSQGRYRVTVDFNQDSEWFGDSCEVELVERDTMVYFWGTWKHVFPYRTLNWSGDVKSNRYPSVPQMLKWPQGRSSPDAKSDGTKIYNVSQMGKEHGVLLPTGEIRCDHCGIVNDDDAKYCKNCGKKLDSHPHY